MNWEVKFNGAGFQMNRDFSRVKTKDGIIGMEKILK
jgi:hypothetical protein